MKPSDIQLTYSDLFQCRDSLTKDAHDSLNKARMTCDGGTAATLRVQARRCRRIAATITAFLEKIEAGVQP
jgi:hypothetical protein